MSCNIIIACECILIKDATVSARAICRLLDEHEDELPEGNFLVDLESKARDLLYARKPCLSSTCKVKSDHDASFCKACGAELGTKGEPMRLAVEKLTWWGEGSGGTWDFFLSDVAPLIKGEVHAIFTWEGGSQTGLAIKDGQVKECEVITTLALPPGW